MRTIPRILSGILLAGAVVFSGIPAVFAQDTAKPVSFAPVSGATTATQLAGLMVTKIDTPNANSGSAISYVLTATREESVCPPPQPGMVSCLAVSRLVEYQIVVTSNTQVLNKNRGMLVGSIEVGDRINAYGALDKTSMRMDAQIVRDLDKPFSTQPVQLDGLRVVNIAQGKDGIQIDAVRGTGPCWNYQGTSRLSYPCPAGTEPAPNVRAAAEEANIGVSTFYSIAVPRTATVMDKNRKTISASSISTGDLINVYGTLVTRGMLQATIVRDLSLPSANTKLSIKVPSGSAQLEVGEKETITFAVSGGTAPYTWSVEGFPDGMYLVEESIVACFRAPCPQPATDIAKVTGTPTMPGTFDGRVTVRDASGAASVLRIPFTVTTDSELAVSVKTNRKSYRLDQDMRVSITVKNMGDKAETLQFTNSCQADYDVNPGFSLRAVQLCMQSLTNLTLKPGASKTYTFDHDIDAHALTKQALPYDVEVVGRVQGVGEAKTKVTLTASR